MNGRSLSYQDMLQIIKIFESSPQLGTLHLKFGDTEIDLDKQHEDLSGKGLAQPAARPKFAAPVVEAVPADKPASATLQPAAPTAAPEGAGVPVQSEMVGTFYAASEPGAKPFVEVGQRIEADTTIGIIEVMKLMTSISAGRAGVITQILVEDGATVEFGQPLILIAPDE